MSEEYEDDDYMGDLSRFLPPETSEMLSFKKKRTENPVSSSEQRSLNWQQRRKISREQQQREEDERTHALTQAALPPSNLGFRMLQQMGYKPGSSLGKDGSGCLEPIAIQIRRSRTGIGGESAEEARARRGRERKEQMRRKGEGLSVEFGERQKSAWRGRKIIADFKKAEAAMAQLEKVEVIVTSVKEEDGSEKGEEEEEVITEEDLEELLTKLRDKHCYCFYCGCQYDSKEELLANCPGDEEDH